MARCIPDLPAPSTRSNAEIELFHALKTQLPDEYQVFHSVSYLRSPDHGRQPAREGELDFLIAHPELGLLALEVKGGDIAYDGAARQWWSRGSDGTHKIKDPFAQARNGIKNIVEKVRKKNLIGPKLDFTHGHAVAFPQCDSRARDLPPDANPAILIDENDLGALPGRIEKIFAFWRKNRDHGPIGAPRLRRIVNQVIAPSFQLAQSLGSVMKREGHVMHRLTTEQQLCLDFLELNPVAIVEGAAGTGKTVLALDYARRLVDSDAKVLLLCYNKLLGAHLARAVRGFTDKPGCIWAGTFHEVCEEWATASGIDVAPPPTGDAKAVDEYWRTDLPMALVAAADKVAHRYDALIVDEAQDFHSDWWTVLADVWVGPDTGRLAIFHDPLQNIFSRDPIAREERPVLPLRVNYRNTAAIARYSAELVGASLEPAQWAVDGEEPKTYHCKSSKEVRKRVESIVDRLLQQRVRPEQITVLSGRRYEHSSLAEVDTICGIPLSQISDEGVHPEGRHLGFSTLHRFKGLDSDVVIFLDVDSGKHVTPAHRYVAASRAKHRLFVVEGA